MPHGYRMSIMLLISLELKNRKKLGWHLDGVASLFCRLQGRDRGDAAAAVAGWKVSQICDQRSAAALSNEPVCAVIRDRAHLYVKDWGSGLLVGPFASSRCNSSIVAGLTKCTSNPAVRAASRSSSLP